VNVQIISTGMCLWLLAARHELNVRNKDSGNIMKVNKNVYNEFMLIFLRDQERLLLCNEEYLLTNLLETESFQA
jgi:hypothetical protein